MQYVGRKARQMTTISSDLRKFGMNLVPFPRVCVPIQAVVVIVTDYLPATFPHAKLRTFLRS